MKAYVITLTGNEYSEEVTQRCINSGKKYGIEVEPFEAINIHTAPKLLKQQKLKWTWADNNTREMICPSTNLKQFPYKCKDLRIKIACSLSHYQLWRNCFYLRENILILEHDAVFIRELPEIDFNGICQINDPKGCTPGGYNWSQSMRERGRGIWPKTLMDYKDNRPDGLAGNSAYLIEPWAAKCLVMTFREIGIWPNDATMCIQLFPFLEEYYPFIIETKQEMSTTC